MSHHSTSDRSVGDVATAVRLRHGCPRHYPRRARLTPLTAVALALVGATAAGCGRTQKSSTPIAVRACSLVSTGDAEAVFADAPSQPPSGMSALESSCTYVGIIEGVSLTTDVTWDPRRLANFWNMANPLAISLPGKTSTGATIPALHWVHLTVAGQPALWLSPVPSIGPGSPTGVSELLGSKAGCVVMTQSTDWTNPRRPGCSGSF